MAITAPTNKVLVQGNPLTDEKLIETVTSMYAGRLVKKGTADHQIVVNTVNNPPLGWLGYDGAHPDKKPATVDTIYTAVDAPILYGGNFVINGRLASGQNVTAGTLLAPAASGELTEATTLTGTVTIATGSTAVTSDKAQPDESVVFGGALPTQGMVVAQAMESVDASGAAADIMVKSFI